MRLVLAKPLVESGVAVSTPISMSSKAQNVINWPCHTGYVSMIKGPKGITLEPNRGFAVTLIWTGILGWFAAFSLVLERIHVATNPSATLSCDLNPFISCKSVMLTPQASLFGFPNALIGIAAFVAPIAVGVAILAGAKFAAWFWRTFAVGVTLGFIFVFWLFMQSTFVIGVLCPYCMVAWAAMVPLFWKVILFGTKDGFIDTPLRFVNFFDNAYEKAWLFTLVTEAIYVAIIIARFWNSWPLLWS
jgi:uncharacterized membrane protein